MSKHVFTFINPTELAVFNSDLTRISNQPGGRGRHSPQILVGTVCATAKWKMGALEWVERENAGLRSELERETAGLQNWLCRTRLTGSVTLWPAVTPGRCPEHFVFRLAAVSRPWAALNSWKVKKFWKWWSPERIFLVTCENDMLWSLELKMGSFAWHRPNMHMEVSPSPLPTPPMKLLIWIHVQVHVGANLAV